MNYFETDDFFRADSSIEAVGFIIGMIHFPQRALLFKNLNLITKIPLSAPPYSVVPLAMYDKCQRNKSFMVINCLIEQCLISGVGNVYNEC